MLLKHFAQILKRCTQAHVSVFQITKCNESGAVFHRKKFNKNLLTKKIIKGITPSIENPTQRLDNHLILIEQT